MWYVVGAEIQFTRGVSEVGLFGDSEKARLVKVKSGPRLAQYIVQFHVSATS